LYPVKASAAENIYVRSMAYISVSKKLRLEPVIALETAFARLA
jgi:hypothetical protein